MTDWRARLRPHADIIAIAAALGAYFALVFWVIGAPIKTPDSMHFLSAALDPQANFGAWRPPGLPWVLWLGQKLFWRVPTTIIAIATLRSTLLYVFLKRCSRKWAPLLLVWFLLNPAWLMMDMSIWAEPLYGACLIGLALAVGLEVPFVARLAAATGIFLLSALVRHTTIFVLPALVAALGMAGARFDRKRLAAAALTVPLAWMALNLARAGSPFRTSREDSVCMQGLVSINAMPYCDWIPESRVCQLDPKREFLNRPDRVNYHDLSYLHYGDTSPIRRLNETLGPEGVCEEYHTAFHAVLTHDALGFAGLLAGRFIRELGPWEKSEGGTPSVDAGIHGSVEAFNAFLSFRNLLAVPFLLVGAAMLAFGAWRYPLTPMVVFLLLAGLGSAAGLALNNPFVVLRYLAVHRFLWGLCVAWYLGRYLDERAAAPSTAAPVAAEPEKRVLPKKGKRRRRKT